MDVRLSIVIPCVSEYVCYYRLSVLPMVEQSHPCRCYPHLAQASGSSALLMFMCSASSRRQCLLATLYVNLLLSCTVAAAAIRQAGWLLQARSLPYDHTDVQCCPPTQAAYEWWLVGSLHHHQTHLLCDMAAYEWWLVGSLHHHQTHLLCDMTAYERWLAGSLHHHQIHLL